MARTDVSPAQPQLNLAFLEALGRAYHGGGEVWLRVTGEGGIREVHLSNGALVGGASSLEGERLGNLLAEEGRFDLDLLTPMVREAQELGVRLGALLVGEGLLSPEDLLRALRRQAATRLLRMLTQPGRVELVPSERDDVPPQPLAALLVDAFQRRLPEAALDPVARRMERRRFRLVEPAGGLDALGLLPEERTLLLEHHVPTGQTPFTQAMQRGGPLGLLAALFALGVLEPL